MQLDKVSLADAHAFSQFFLDYITAQQKLRPFYHRFPLLENFHDQLSEKAQAFPAGNRAVLAKTLKTQYEGFNVSPQLETHLASLSDPNTFTITTGHQLNIFTGPLYFIFKIVTVINACKRLKEQYPAFNFVPVYWMASEDHDYDEIKYFRLHGRKYTWETDQTGAVGRFSTKGLDKLAAEIPGDNAIFSQAYSKRKTLASATRHYVNELFGAKGLVVIDADSRELKKLFQGVIREDVLQQVNKPLVDQSDKSLQALGYKTQIFCRDINFFYLADGIRSRLELVDGRYNVVDTDLSFSKEEIEKMIAEEPERFSPNVILRPVYQEMILPNIAYAGGPAEVIYWLQLKEVFAHFRIPFPMLMPRNFGMVIEHEVGRKWSKTKLSLADLFEDTNSLFNKWILAHSTHDLCVDDERKLLGDLFARLKQRAETIDVTLGQFVDASAARAIKDIEKTEQKMLRAEKRRESDKLRQIAEVKDILFPGGSLQERADSFLNFYHRDPDFIERLFEHFDPFDFRFNVLSYTAT